MTPMDPMALYRERNRCALAFAFMAMQMGWRVGRLVDANEPGWPVLMVDIPATELATTATAQTKVCALDADLLAYRWYDNGAGYLKRQDHLSSPTGYLHRVVAERMFGVIATGWEVDHVDRDPTNNTRGNLRLATSRVQKLNLARVSVRQRKSGRWQAMRQENGRQVSLGMSLTRGEAEARCRAARERALVEAEAMGEVRYWFAQVSWHLPAAEMPRWVPTYDGEWDGHTTEEKYERIEGLAR